MAVAFLIQAHQRQGVLKVIIKRWTAGSMMAMAIICITSQSTMAQAQVALVDVGQIFKSHPQFSAQLEQLKQAAEQVRAEATSAAQDLQREVAGLKSLEPGSPDFNAMESRLAQRNAAMEVEIKSKMRSLMEKEARLHYDTYQQVKEAIGRYCVENQIRAVLRHNNQPVNPNEPGSVMQRVNSNVVFHKSQIDITPVIIRMVGGSLADASQTQNR